MCCSPDHVGAPPEWYRESAYEDGQGPGITYPGRGVSLATLAAWARLLEPRAFVEQTAPASSEGGSGRALVTSHHPPPPAAYRPPVSFTELALWNPARRIERAKRKGAGHEPRPRA